MMYQDLHDPLRLKNLHACMHLKGGSTLQWWWAQQNQVITHPNKKAETRKETLCFVHLNRQEHFKTNKYSLLLCKKLSFLSENFRVLCKYKAKVAMGAMEGTVQEGCIPTWREVVFVTTFLSQMFPKYFIGQIYINQKKIYW